MASGSKLAGVFMLGLTLAAPSLAQDAATAGWTDVPSLYALPTAVQKHLGVDADSGTSVISDRSGPFNAGDLVQPGVPDIRFVQALASGDSLLVLVEVGGRGYHYTVREFDRANDRWDESAPHPGAWPEWLLRKYGPLQAFQKAQAK